MKKIICFLLPFALLSSFAPLSYGEEVRNKVFVLLDTSGSYFDEKRKAVVRRHLNVLRSILKDESRNFSLPATFDLIRIGSFESRPKPVCELKLALRDLFGKPIGCSGGDNACYAKKGEIKAYFDICIKDVLKQKAENATNIEASLKLVDKLVADDYEKNVYLIILSDMIEYNGQGVLAPENINLNNFHILVICGDIDTRRPQGADCENDVKERWVPRFQEIGAYKKDIKIIYEERYDWNFDIWKD